jgi:hypothetical protein
MGLHYVKGGAFLWLAVCDGKCHGEPSPVMRIGIMALTTEGMCWGHI